MMRLSDTDTPAKLNTRKRKIDKSDDDLVPLPDPFPLSKHYRADIETALRSQEMTKETRKAFLSSVASIMLIYKRYPTSADYENVAKTICKKYTFLKSPVGKPESAIVESLKNRFKEFRRDKKPRLSKKITESPDSSQCLAPLFTNKQELQGKLPGQTIVVKSQCVPEGEDDISFARHNKVLQSEYKKAKPNSKVVEELMDLSFAFRRKEITDNPCGLKELFGKYPFLQIENYLIKEMQKISGEIELSNCEKEWENIQPKIMSQAKLNSQNSRQLQNIIDKIPENGNTSLITLVVLSVLLPDSKSRPDHNKIVFFSEGDYGIESIVKSKKQPLLVSGNLQHNTQCFLITDCQIVMEVKGCLALVLLAAFYVYNIAYPKGCNNFYAFLENFFLKTTTCKLSSSVKHFLSTIS